MKPPHAEGRSEATRNGDLHRLGPIANVGNGATKIGDRLGFALRRLELGQTFAQDNVLAGKMSISHRNGCRVDRCATGVENLQRIRGRFVVYRYRHQAERGAIGLSKQPNGAAFHAGGYRLDRSTYTNDPAL